MTVNEFAKVLQGINDSEAPYEEGEYTSHTTGNKGYWVCYHIGKLWFWYSVSDTTDIVLPSKVVQAIMSGECQRSGPFKGNGFEATVRFDARSYMLGMGSTKPNRRKR
jgi:hypothetical protein